MILLILCNELLSKQSHQHGCVLRKKEGAKPRPSAVVPLLSFSFGKQKADFSGRWLVVKAPSCLWYFQSLKGLAESLGPSPLAFWPHHSQMLRTSHQNKGWGFLWLEKKPPCARRWACGIHRCISTGGSCRKKDASQKLQLQVQGREGNPWDRARVCALQGGHCPDRIPDRGRKRVMANQRAEWWFHGLAIHCFEKLLVENDVLEPWAGGCCWNLSGGS